ncbi:MAG: hypothetical protein J6T70_03015 [Bacteroidales bacterium]|nr:hypothetical protein [Bacteroidales bacterium]
MKLPSLLLFLIICTSAMAQRQQNIMLMAKPGRDRIELRWAPVSYPVWDEAKQCGYIFEKYLVAESGDSVWAEKQFSKNIKIADISEWEPFADNNYTAVAAECIFGERETYTDFNPITAYKKHNDNEQRFGFALYCADMDTTTARLAGLYYNDTDVDKSSTYIYSVRLATADTLYTDTAVVMSSIRAYRPLYPPPAPTIVVRNRAAHISWDTQATPYYIAYYIEKSEDGKHFEKISEQPISATYGSFEMRIIDTLETDGKAYYYRAYGFDSFGESGPMSDVSKCIGKPEITSVPELTYAETVNNNSVVINWTYDANQESAIEGYKIYRSKSSGGTKQLLSGNISPQSRSFTDSKPLNDNYYFISAYNSVSEVINPFPSYAMLIDSVPPAAPAPPEGFCDSLGRVTVYWHRSTDPDVIGYRLFRANLPDVEFVMACPYMIKDTTYTDTITLNTSTEYIYYRLKAVDGRDNQSAMSPPAAVARYDTIPPSPPRISNVEIARKKNIVSWHKSVSGDVKNVVLFRKTNLNSKFDTLAILQPRDTEYSDNNIEEGETYYYALKAMDNGGLWSSLSNIMAADIPAKSEKIVFTTTVTPNGIKLKWNTDQLRKKVVSTVVFRAVDTNDISTYAIVHGNEYTDTNVSAGKTYKYCIRHQFDDGTESSLSDEGKISF